MSDILDEVCTILAGTSPDKPWMTARAIARRIGGGADKTRIEELLLTYCRDCEDDGRSPTVRYSSLPSRRTLEVLWGDVGKVGSRRLENITKDDVADDSLAEFGGLEKADVFLSHSHRDYHAVMKVAKLLLDDGVVPWLAETHIGQDKHIHEEIIRALGASQAFLLFLSPHALDSRWTGKEYYNARSRGIPIIVVADIDHAETRQLLMMMFPGGSADSGVRNRLEGGTREFFHSLIADNGHIVDVFAYSREADPDTTGLPPVRPVLELPGVIGARRTGGGEG